ncbi:MAG: sulfotransferase [Ectothiorhodospiraceae bacterium]|nr:sulfotransferase [Chromatiales bacterium]MCP5154838.1 sulfotransferase [Ectothiorhodospiraceae bacterium]
MPRNGGVDATRRLEEEVLALRRERLAAPDDAARHAALAARLALAGDRDGAVHHYRRSLGIEPRQPRVWWALGLALDGDFADDERAALSRLLAETPPHDPGRIETLFALGDAHHRRGDHAAAFACWTAGNRLRRREGAYDRAAHEATVAAITSAPPRRFTPPPRDAGGPGTLLVVGMPRSGSTLLERLLTRHPDVASAGECEHLPRLVHDPAAAGIDDGAALFPRLPGRLRASSQRALAAAYQGELVARAGAGWRWVIDKLPYNVFYLEAAFAFVDDLRVVHLERDAADTVLGCYRRLFPEGQEFSYDLDDLLHFYRLYRRVAEHWRRHLGDRVLHVAYEDLVRAPERTLARVLDHLELPGGAAGLLAREDTGPLSDTLSLYQVQGPVDDRHVGRWRPYARWLAPVVRALGD